MNLTDPQWWQVLLGFATLVAVTITAWVELAKHRAERRAEEPEVETSIEFDDWLKDRFRLSLTVRNFASTTLTLKALEVRSPTAARIDLVPNNPTVQSPPPDRRVVALTGNIDPIGGQRSSFSLRPEIPTRSYRSDHMRIETWLVAPPAARRVKLRLHCTIKRRDERAVLMTLNIKMPAANRSSTP